MTTDGVEAELPESGRRPDAQESLYHGKIVQALRQAETGTTPVVEICRKLGVTETTFYRWNKQYGGLDPHELRELKQLREENRRLKQLVADRTLDKVILKDAVAKAW